MMTKRAFDVFSSFEDTGRVPKDLSPGSATLPDLSPKATYDLAEPSSLCRA